MSQIIELADKYTKAALKNTLQMHKKVDESLNMIRRDSGDTFLKQK